MRNKRRVSPAPSRSSGGPTLADVLDRTGAGGSRSLADQGPGFAQRDRALLHPDRRGAGPDCSRSRAASLPAERDQSHRGRISSKSFANIRSDLFAAITASGLKPISPPSQA